MVPSASAKAGVEALYKSVWSLAFHFHRARNVNRGNAELRSQWLFLSWHQCNVAYPWWGVATVTLLLLFMSDLWLQSGGAMVTGSTSSSLDQSEPRYCSPDRNWCFLIYFFFFTVFVVVYLIRCCCLLCWGGIQPFGSHRSIWEGDDRSDPNRSTWKTGRNCKPGSIHEQWLCYLDVWSCEFLLVLDQSFD